MKDELCGILIRRRKRGQGTKRERGTEGSERASDDDGNHNIDKSPLHLRGAPAKDCQFTWKLLFNSNRSWTRKITALIWQTLSHNSFAHSLTVSQSSVHNWRTECALNLYIRIGSYMRFSSFSSFLQIHFSSSPFCPSASWLLREAVVLLGGGKF